MRVRGRRRLGRGCRRLAMSFARSFAPWWKCLAELVVALSGKGFFAPLRMTELIGMTDEILQISIEW